MTRPGGRVLRVALVGLLTLAAALRLLDFLAVRPLWLDEAMLAVGIGRLSFGGLSGPLPFDQSAPLLFLWSIKAVTLIAGMGEMALRLVPLLTGIALPWLVWRTAKTLAGADAALIAATLTAVSLPLIRYSAELKPYGTDAFVSIALVALALRVRASPERAAGWWLLLAGGIAGMAASHAAPFVLAGVWVALAVDARVRNAVLGRKRLILLTLGWGAGFALLFAWLYLPQSGSPFMQAFWAETFLDPGAPNFSRRMYAAARTLTSALPSIPDWVPVKLSVILLGAGILLLVRRGGLPALAHVGVPFAAMGVGAIVAHYPVAMRLFLFLAPFVFIGFGVLIAELARLMRLGEAGAGLAGAALVLAWAMPGLLGPGNLPARFGNGREPARLVLGSAGNEPVYILPGGLPAWAYYSTDWSRPDTRRLDHFAWVGRADGPGVLNALVPEADTVERRSLVYRGEGRLELIGTRVGIGYSQRHGFIGTSPDSIWAAREVDRIVSAAKPYAWLFGGHLWDPIRSVMLAELSRRGIRVVTAVNEEFAVALRVRVPGAPAPAP